MIPRTLLLRCFVDDQPFPGAWVETILGMRRKNAFVSFHGPADAQGSLMVEGTKIALWAEAARRFAIMDYGNPDTESSGVLKIRPLSIASAEGALAAFKLFGAYLPFPANYENLLKVAIERLMPKRGSLGSLSIAYIDPPECATVLAEKVTI